MVEINEAVKLIKELLEDSNYTDIYSGASNEPMNIALELAIEALEKQIPKNPKVGTEITLLDSFGAPEPPEYEWKCPHCEATVNESNFYCSFCGQSLEWDKWEV